MGLTVGVALLWYGSVSEYFPAVVAIMIFIGVLIPLENQEKQMAQLLDTVHDIRNRMNSLENIPSAPSVPVPKQEERQAFIPTIQSETSSSNPAPQKKRTVDRSMEDVAKKLSSMQGR